MPDTIYSRDGDVFTPTRWATGPWSSDLQHGGPVNGLFARAAEEAAREAGLRVVRLTVDLFKPVPVEPLACRWHFVRRGARLANVEATLTRPDDAEPISRGAAVLVRPRPEIGEVFSIGAGPAPDFEAARSIDFLPRGARGRFPEGFHSSVEVRLGNDARGAVGWVTTPLGLVEGEETTPFVRCAAVADLTFGLSGRILLEEGRIEPEAWSSVINGDTTLYLEREPSGRWFAFRDLRLSAAGGSGVSAVDLADEHGPLGSALQTLVATSRPAVEANR